MPHKWKKGQIGYYRAMQGEGPVIEARVLRCHRDQTVTVQALWKLDADGNQTGLFVGYKYRFEARLLSPTNPGTAATFRQAFELGLAFNPNI